MKTMNDKRKANLTKRATDIILLLLGFTDRGCCVSQKNIINFSSQLEGTG